MPVRLEHLIDVTLDDSPTSQAGSWDFQGAPPKRVSLYVQIVKTLSPTNVTLTVELSPDDGQTLISYDKLLTEAGTDQPAASVVYTTTVDDVVDISPETALDYIRILVAATGTDATNFFAVDVWLVWES